MNWKQWIVWVLTSVVLPAFAPLVIAYTLLAIMLLAGCPPREQPDMIALFNTFIDKGVYSFLAITVLLGLLQDYKLIAPIFIIAITLLLIFLGALFVNSLGMTTGETPLSANIKTAFLVITGFSLVFGAIIKINILKKQ